MLLRAAAHRITFRVCGTVECAYGTVSVSSISVCILSLCTLPYMVTVCSVARRTVNSAVVRVFCTQATACVFCVFRTSIIRAAICTAAPSILRTDFFALATRLRQPAGSER